MVVTRNLHQCSGTNGQMLNVGILHRFSASKLYCFRREKLITREGLAKALFAVLTPQYNSDSLTGQQQNWSIAGAQTASAGTGTGSHYEGSIWS